MVLVWLRASLFFELFPYYAHSQAPPPSLKSQAMISGFIERKFFCFLSKWNAKGVRRGFCEGGS